MNKPKKERLPEKRALTVDEIISKYPMSVRILLVQLVEQVERLEKKKPKVTEEFIKRWVRKIGYEDYVKQMLKEAGIEVVKKEE